MDDVRSAPFQPSSSSSVDDIPLENHATATSIINFDDDDDALYAFFDHGLLETLFNDEMFMNHGDDNPNNSDISFRSEGTTTREVLVSASVTTKEGDSCCNTDGHYSHLAAAVAVAPPFLLQPPRSISGGTSSHTSSTGTVIASSTTATATQYHIPFSNNTVPAIATPSITIASTATAAAAAYPMPTTTTTTSTTMNEHQIAALQAEYRNGLAAAAVLSQRQQQQQQILINTTTTRSTPAATPALIPTTTSSLHPNSSFPFSTNSTSIMNNTNPYTHHPYPIQPPYQRQPQQTLLQPNATTKKKRKSKKSTLPPLAKPPSTTISIPTPYLNSNSMNTITKTLQQHQQQVVNSCTTKTNTTTATNQKISSCHSKDNTPSPVQMLPPCNNTHIDQNNSVGNNNKPAATTSLEEAEKLVSHFASLAEKLGISLPQNVLASLTRTAAVMHGERQQQPQSDVVPSSLPQQQFSTTTHPSTITPLSVTHSHHHQDLHKQPKLTTSFIPPSSSISTQQQQQQQQQNSSALVSKIVNQTPPITNEIEMIPSILSKIPPMAPSVAEHKGNVNNNKEGVESVDGSITKVFAICALDKEEQENTIDIEGIEAVTVQPHCEEKTSSTTTAAAVSMAPKKRKRPRVEECARKLSALKDENRILKLHLDAMLEKTKTADLERAQAERDMREMVQYKDGTAVDKEKLQKLVSRFTEMYADYGKSRQQELRFHLEQLRK
jgi:hypothetical protein